MSKTKGGSERVRNGKTERLCNRRGRGHWLPLSEFSAKAAWCKACVSAYKLSRKRDVVVSDVHPTVRLKMARLAARELAAVTANWRTDYR
jgi:hypothetical protein